MEKQVEMNNYDGTSDFIIVCTENHVQSLRGHPGLTILTDTAMPYEIPKILLGAPAWK